VPQNYKDFTEIENLCSIQN